MEAPFATACVLSYNRPQFIEEALLTMVGNAHYPLEVIVHDDGSSDPAVRSFLRACVDAGTISTLIENPPGHNQGQGIALNRMFEMAKGDPIVKLDQDMLFRPDWLAESVRVLESNEVKSIGDPDKNTEPKIGALGLFRYRVEPCRYEDMFIRDWDGWEEHEDFVGSAMVIPRRAWRHFGPFGEHSDAFAEDAVFKHTIRDTDGWANGLLPSDAAQNQGFGVGPSTVVVDHGQVATIHKGPKLVNGALTN